MELDQILKKIEWLDDERRKDKNLLATLEEKVKAAEEHLLSLQGQNKDLNSEVNRLRQLVSRVEQLDESLLKTKIETKQIVDDLEKEFRRREEETEKVRRVELKTLEKGLGELRKDMSAVTEIRRSLQTRAEENIRMLRSIEELREGQTTTRRNEEEVTRLYRLVEEGRRQDIKRLADAQGELASTRKRVDDLRGQSELTGSSLRKIEVRIGELESTGQEQKQAQNKFIEEQSLIHVERERVWKEWLTRFDDYNRQSEELRSMLQVFDTTNLSIARTQSTVDELAQKVERRINEITELQRLGEERFRQEWVTFRSDDQKRWTNYVLLQEEQRGELNRLLEKINARVVALEDSSQEISDLVHILSEHTEKRLQSLLAMLHEWVTDMDNSSLRNL